MQLTRSLLGRFIPFKPVPGSLWAGKQRRIPRLTHARKAAFLDELLLSEQNHRYLSNPCISREVEAATIASERARELKAEDAIFYERNASKFHARFPTREVTAFWKILNNTKGFDV